VSRTMRILLALVRLWLGLAFLKAAVGPDATMTFRLVCAGIGGALIWWTISRFRRPKSA
jgi:hypothetical protein